MLAKTVSTGAGRPTSLLTGPDCLLNGIWPATLRKAAGQILLHGATAAQAACAVSVNSPRTGSAGRRTTGGQARTSGPTTATKASRPMSGWDCYAANPQRWPGFRMGLPARSVLRPSTVRRSSGRGCPRLRVYRANDKHKVTLRCYGGSNASENETSAQLCGGPLGLQLAHRVRRLVRARPWQYVLAGTVEPHGSSNQRSTNLRRIIPDGKHQRRRNPTATAPADPHSEKYLRPHSRAVRDPTATTGDP